MKIKQNKAKNRLKKDMEVYYHDYPESTYDKDGENITD